MSRISRFRGLLSLGFVVVASVARLGTEFTADASYFLLAAYALLGRGPAIQAIALSWLFTMLSPGIAEATPGAAAGRFVVLVTAAVSILARSKVFHGGTIVTKVTTLTVLLGLFFVVHALLFSAIVDVSVLKAVSWTMAMATLFSAWGGLTPDEHVQLSKQIFGGLVMLMLGSVPLLAMPLGYLVNGTGFQGLLNHPQVFGSTMALLGAWAAGRMIGERRPRWTAVAVVAGCIVLVFLSEARTAGLALVFGIGIAMIFSSAMSGRPMRAVLPGLRSQRVFVVALLAFVIAAVAGPSLFNLAETYVTKRAGGNNLIDLYEMSRGDVIRQMWHNIEDEPFQGIGFGIASNPAEMEIKRDPVFGLPISAPIEKGVLPLAVLEELGLVGFAAVVAWVLFLLRRSSAGGVAPFSVVLTALFLNMGESTLFSPGGMGLLSLVLIGWAFACGKRAERVG